MYLYMCIYRFVFAFGVSLSACPNSSKTLQSMTLTAAAWPHGSDLQLVWEQLDGVFVPDV